MQKRIYISIPLLLLVLGVFSQTSNPFDLKWRSKKSPSTVLSSETEDSQLVFSPASEVATDSVQSNMTDADLIDSATDPNTKIPFKDSFSDDKVSDSLSAVSSLPFEPDPDVSNSNGTTLNNPTSDGITSGESNADDPATHTLDNEESSIPSKDMEIEEPKSTLPSGKIIEKTGRSPYIPAKQIGMALFLVLFGLALVILTWAVNINRGFIQKIYKAALNENFSALLLREQRFASSQYLYYIVYAVFFLNGGLFIYLISRYATWDFGHRNTPMILFLVFLALVYILKHVVTRLLGETFQISKEMRHYNFNVILYNILAGIALMPVNLFLAFGPTGMRMPMIYAGLGIIVLMYLMRQFRGIIMGSHLIVKNGFEFFVYLCAIEILPVLVLFKFFPN